MNTDYIGWNNRIASHFFRPEMEGRTVFLYVTEELLNDLGRPFNEGMLEFLKAVKQGPPWVTRQGICQKALQSMIKWHSRKSEFPPYIAYLALFTLAASIEGDFAVHSYYPRLRTLLGEGDAVGQYPSFHQMLSLWDDLEKWSNEEKQGCLGVFHTPLVGNCIHVGVPIAQTLLTERERNTLSQIFVDAKLDPTSPLSDHELATLLARYGQSTLTNKTLRLLQSPRSNDNNLRSAILEAIEEELLEWDGENSSQNLNI